MPSKRYLKSIGHSDADIRKIELSNEHASKEGFDLPIVEKGVRSPMLWRLKNALGMSNRGESESKFVQLLVGPPALPRPRRTDWQPVDAMVNRPNQPQGVAMADLLHIPTVKAPEKQAKELTSSQTSVQARLDALAARYPARKESVTTWEELDRQGHHDSMERLLSGFSALVTATMELNGDQDPKKVAALVLELTAGLTTRLRNLGKRAAA